MQTRRIDVGPLQACAMVLETGKEMECFAAAGLPAAAGVGLSFARAKRKPAP